MKYHDLSGILALIAAWQYLNQMLILAFERANSGSAITHLFWSLFSLFFKAVSLVSAIAIYTDQHTLDCVMPSRSQPC